MLVVPADLSRSLASPSFFDAPSIAHSGPSFSAPVSGTGPKLPLSTPLFTAGQDVLEGIGLAQARHGAGSELCTKHRLVLFREERTVDDRLQQHGGAVVKRKRTKRPRHQTPLVACSSASSSESTTTEEEDMAHCLILLAQGAAPPVDSRPPPPALATVSQEARQGTPSLPPPGPLPAPATKTERYTSRK
ncbi:hypothetical protein ZWY2020_040867 [Hordeum vulgare]|nr:hypothetical protein ZWY2020_040867 [Hordeum vulgare]